MCSVYIEYTYIYLKRVQQAKYMVYGGVDVMHLAKSNGVVFRGDKYLSPVLVLRVIDYATLRR